MNLDKNNIVIFLGPPGSGKGTLSQLCVDRLGWVQFSTGDLLREHISNKTDLGKKIDFIIKSGKLISDILMIEIAQDWILKQLNMRSILILDGFPRTENQAIALNKMVKSSCLKYPDLVVVKLEISDENIISRLLNRVVCEDVKCKAIYSLDNKLNLYSDQEKDKCSLCLGNLVKRSDDVLSSIYDRLKIYHQNESKILEILDRSNAEIVSLNVERPIEVVYKELSTKLGLNN